MPRRIAWAVLGLAWGVAPVAARGEPPPETFTVRLIRPDQQLKRLIGLFRGASAPHPAAALAAWKRAHPGARGLTKAAEAAMAALNPEMVPELRLLDGAELIVGFEPEGGRTRWRATVPRDDGTFSALATALVLSGGAAEPPLAGVGVDRLGPPGAPLMAARGPSVALAATRDDLEAALAPARARGEAPPLDSGAWIRLDPATLVAARPIGVRRLAEALGALRCRGLSGTAAIEGAAACVVLKAELEAPRALPPIEPAWLSWVPRASAVAAAAFSIDPSPASWDLAFTLADRVERADPARGQVAPLRARLALVAAACGVRPEVDLWPVLRGGTIVVLADDAGEIDGGLLALHAADPVAAARIADLVIPRLAASLLRGKADAPPGEKGEGRTLGRVAGRPLAVTRRGATVLLGWGAATLPACLEAHDHSPASAGPLLPADRPPPQRAGAFWPGRSRRLSSWGSAAVKALAAAGPVLWTGRTEGPSTRDEIRWPALDALVRDLLARLEIGPAGGE